MNKKASQYIHISSLILKEYDSLVKFISELSSKKGGLELLDSSIVKIYEVHNFNGLSGYNYWIDGEMIGQLHLGSLSNGWYVIYKKVFFEKELIETYSYYDQKGQFSYSSEVFSNTFEIYDSVDMDPYNPFVNHLYNILSSQYDLTLNAKGNSKRIQLFEKILTNLYQHNKKELSASDYKDDLSVVKIRDQILYLENDRVLRWTERQKIFDNLLHKRNRILKTKKRVHSFNYFTYVFPFIFKDILMRFNLVRIRPFNNIKGILYKYTIGKMLWFLVTVKENLGYSIALAIYGPFTYYFITQPMNPHALWVVGEVRETYINTVEKIESLIEKKNNTPKTKAKDSVSTKLASNKNLNSLPTPNYKWSERMSHFKAMQIAHESNLIFAERMGRLEQIETQFNFPLAIESAWNEITRYQRAIKGTLSYVKNLDFDFKNFLNEEIKRSFDDQVYLWERMAQFLIDYPYILVDELDEQTQKNNYTGRVFVFMQKMTDSLSKIKTLTRPQTHENISSLATFYKKNKIQTNSIIKNLEANSRLFADRDIFNTDKLRSYMKRHWEVLFLQQNKKQEAASFAMQAYSASIKNAIWTLQSLYSTKRDDHLVLSYKFNLANQNTDATITLKENNELIESLLHFITFDYVSIKKEFSQNLKNDKEARLRENMIRNIRDYVTQRDVLLNKNKKVFVKKLSDTI